MKTVLPNILVISDIRLYREGVVTFLMEDPRVGFAKACAGSGSAIKALQKDRFSVVCVDNHMEAAIPLTNHLIKKNFKVVLLGLKNASNDVIDGLHTGISGYVCSDASLDELVHIIKSAVILDVTCTGDDTILSHQCGKGSRSFNTSNPRDKLTCREQEISRLLELGWSNKRIASYLNITVSTTKNHVHNILEKLCLGSRSEVVALLNRDVLNPVDSVVSMVSS